MVEVKLILDGIKTTDAHNSDRLRGVLVDDYSGGRMLANALGFTGELSDTYSEFLERELFVISLEEAKDPNARTHRFKLNIDEQKASGQLATRTSVQKTETDKSKIIRLATDHAFRIMMGGDNLATILGIAEYSTGADATQTGYSRRGTIHH